MSHYYQKYIFKITGHNIVSSKEVLIRNLTQNPDKLDFVGQNFKLENRCLEGEVVYLGPPKGPTGIIKVNSENIEDLEKFDKTIKEIINCEKKFSEFRCIYDGISSYYSAKIYSKLHNIERQTQEFLKELFYISDESGELKQFKATLKDMDKENYSFSKLINHIFHRGEITDKFLEHIESCIETGTIPNGELVPRSLWDGSTFTGDRQEGHKINSLLEEIRKTRNKIAHCRDFSKADFDNCNIKINELVTKLNEVIKSIENSPTSKEVTKEAERISNSMQSEDSEIKQEYFQAYELFEGDLCGQLQNSEINWKQSPAKELNTHREFYLKFSEKTDDEIKEEIKKLRLINFIDEEATREDEVTLDVPIFEDDSKDLTLIVPAQEEGFREVFLGEHQWYDIRLGKARRNKIKYIAGYEVAPRSGIQYIAKVEKIIPSDNYLGYWKVIFDGEPKKYSRLIPLGDTYPPQNIRYTNKSKLDEVERLGGTLKEVFNNPDYDLDDNKNSDL